MKRLAFFITVLTLAGCSASAAAANNVVPIKAQPATQVTFVQNVLDLAYQARLTKAVTAVESRIGKTWYVFSGSTPAGWDCSGLVRWAYEQVGIELPHSANKQGHLGQWVKVPRVGDIVVFGYPGTTTFYHSALYVGNGYVVHAGFRRGMRTAKISLASPSFKNSSVRFVRIDAQP